MAEKNNKLVGIQGLRFCTAVLVLVFHASLFAWSSPANHQPSWEPISQYWYVLNAGNVGVLIFFVISGYVMCLTRDTSVKTFVSLRLARIYPGYVTALVMGTALMLWDGFLKPDQMVFDPSMLLLPIGNPHPSWSGVQYWTLSFEVYFYFITAMIMLMPKKLYGWLMVAWAICLLIVYPRFPNPPDSLFGIMVWGSPYGLYFIAGALVALARQGQHGPLGAFLSSVGLATLIGQRHEFLWQLLLLVTCVGITYSAANIRNPAANISKHINSLGNWSYGIYLIHFPIIFVMREIGPMSEMSRFILMVSVSLAGGILFGMAEDRVYRKFIRPRVAFLSKANLSQNDQGIGAFKVGASG